MFDCEPNMTYEECEANIIKHNADKIEKHLNSSLIENQNIKEITQVVEDFLRDRQRVCYGGTAINNTLPKNMQFYDYNFEVPDYDFYSPEPIQDSVDLANIFYKRGYTSVEVRSSSLHKGVFKVFVNSISVADIKFMNKKLYDSLHKNAVVIDDIYYAPIEFIRRNMYLELSRPKGDVSRWEKVVKRLNLFNSYYKRIAPKCNLDELLKVENSKEKKDILRKLRNIFINEQAVFIGLFSKSFLFKYKPVKYSIDLSNIPNFDVIHADPERLLDKIKNKFQEGDITIIEYPEIDSVIKRRYQIKYKKDTIAYIYEPSTCNNYNEVTYKNKKVRIGTTDTILSFYLLFLYLDDMNYDIERLMCLSDYLLQIQRENRLSQRSPLRRFTLQCVGKQETTLELRQQREQLYNEMKERKQKVRKDYDMYFFTYKPSAGKKNKNNKTKKKTNNKQKKTTKTRNNK